MKEGLWTPGVHLLQGKQRGVTAPAKRIDARQNQRAGSRLHRGASHVFLHQNTASLVIKCGMRDHPALADTRSFRERWEGIALSDPKRSRNPLDTIKPLDWTTCDSKERHFLGTQKWQAQNPPAPLSIGDEARSLSVRKASRAGAPANGSSPAKPNGIGRRLKPQRSPFAAAAKSEKPEQSDGEADEMDGGTSHRVGRPPRLRPPRTLATPAKGAH